jgi:carbon monoxide dehydrogenase subunit G
VKISSVHRLRASREKVFAALLDPSVLARCIEGCQSLKRVAPDLYSIELKVGVGAVRGTYKGTVKIQDPIEPESFTLSIDGKGLTGFVRSTTRIRLVEIEEGGTELHADADASVGGVIAAVGSRLVEGVAKKFTQDFFDKLAAEVDSGE